MFHADLPAQDIHVIGYVQAGDPGAIGAGKPWVDTSGGSGAYELAVRNALNNGWEYVLGHAAAPDNAQYVVMALDATLTQERVLAVDSHLTLTDGGAGGNATIGVDLTAGFAWTGSHTFTQDAGFGTLSPLVPVHIREDFPPASTVSPVMYLEGAITGGIGGTNFGPAIYFLAESTTTEGRVQSAAQAFWVDPTDATRTGGLRFLTIYQSTLYFIATITGPQAAITEGSGHGYGVYDFQSLRTNAARVPSGDYSCAFGGGEHTISGDYSGVFAGTFNEVSSNFAVALGGAYNEVSDTYGVTIGGSRAVSDKFGQIANSNGVFANDGDAQNTPLISLRRLVTHNDLILTYYSLYPDGGTTPRRITIANDTAWTFECLVVGTDQGCAKSIGYQVRGLIKNAGGVLTITNQSTTNFDADDIAFNARANTDAINKALIIEVADTTVPAQGDTIRWSAFLRMTEVTYPT